MPPLHASQMYQALIDAGIADESTISVIIEIPVDEMVRVYVTKYGDERLFKVVDAMTEHSIEIVTPEGNTD